MSLLLVDGRLGFVSVNCILVLHSSGLNCRELLLCTMIGGLILTNLVVFKILLVQILIGTLREVAALKRLQGLVVVFCGRVAAAVLQVVA